MTEQKESPYAGEPFYFWTAEENISSFMEERGFEVKQHLNPDHISETYLKLNNGSLAGNVIPSFCFVEAVVK